MYESYWNLTNKPFPLRNETSRFYRSKSHHAALLRLKYSIDNLHGPNVVLGMSGTGKSSLVSVLADQDKTLRPFVPIVFPSLESDELLRMIAQELNDHSPSPHSRTDELLRTIQKALHQHCSSGAKPVICFDDAHLLSDDALQSVVLPLLNMAELDAHCRLSVLLVGQPVLAANIRRIGSLSERVAVTTALQGFTHSETADYVRSCVTSAGGSLELFSDKAIDRLFEVTAGNPRRINRLCEMCLLVGYAEQLRQITEQQIESVAAELMPAAA
jgi:type II secretory pathway predicted ATPase ExeA